MLSVIPVKPADQRPRAFDLNFPDLPEDAVARQEISSLAGETA